MPLEKLLKPTDSEQVMALWNSVSEILWNVGEKTKTIVCLPGDVPHISHSHAYFQDNVTEKVSRQNTIVKESSKFSIFFFSCGFLSSTNLRIFKSLSSATFSTLLMTLVLALYAFSIQQFGHEDLKMSEPI